MNVDVESWQSLQPRRVARWCEEAGRCVVLKPRFGDGLVGRWMASLVRTPHYRIHLDDVGTQVWLAADGETSLAEIVRRLQARFGSRIEPAGTRLRRFVAQLYRARVVEFQLPGRAYPDL